MTFIDFCAGIGGGRLGLESLGMKCAGFSETDKKAEETYRLFFGHKEKNYGDLMRLDPSDLPDFDLLLAGFPCQAFSIAGQRKGLADKRGQIIFGLIKIMRAKNVKYFILENVKGLVSHARGQTFERALKLLRAAGYELRAETLDSSHYGLPHKRERVYFIGAKKSLGNLNLWDSCFSQELKRRKMSGLKRCLIDDSNKAFRSRREKSYQTFLGWLGNKYNQGRFSAKELLKEEYLIIDARQSDLRLYRGKIPTLRAGRQGILYVKEGEFRKLSGYEALLLQGFPKKMALKAKGRILNSCLLSQAGNAMTAPVVSACGKSLISCVSKYINPGKIGPAARLRQSAASKTAF